MDAAVSAQLHLALADASLGVALFDAGDRLRFANGWFESTYGVRASEAPSWEDMMRRCHATGHGVLIESADIDAWIASVRQRYRQVPVRSFQSDLADGRWVWVTETLRPDGWLSMFVSDVSPLKATELSLRDARDEAVRVSMKDPLTDLYNRRFIMSHLGEMLASARAMRWPLSIAMIDIDHFKRINDDCGQDVGDAVLSHFGEQMRRQLRPRDAIGRIGGEEFLLVLANTGIDGTEQMLARVRQMIEVSTAHISPAALALPAYTFSAGIALATQTDTLDSLFRRADQALFQAKRDGRNRDWAVNSRSMRI